MRPSIGKITEHTHTKDKWNKRRKKRAVKASTFQIVLKQKQSVPAKYLNIHTAAAQ